MAMASARGVIIAAESTTDWGRWIHPADAQSPPLWGHAAGLRIGLAPLRGPRGLLRVYAPYLNHPDGRVINFIAIEPIPHNETRRGLSELEYSRLDQSPGKRFWSRNDLNDLAPLPTEEPASGWLETIDGVECLRVFVLVERFDNGAHVCLRLTFRADRPHEVGVALFAHADSTPLAHCIATATMGNFARLRQLTLAERAVNARELWPNHLGDGFTRHASFGLSELQRTSDGAAVAVATPDEANPAAAQYAAGTRSHWHYVGETARQYWRCSNPPADLQVLVNGRTMYWASQSPIPGGVSFENFEMVAPFRNGGEFWFGVEPVTITRK